ncbi:MAG: glycosyltransferase family 39 protein [Planctomycetaceae bacterium]
MTTGFKMSADNERTEFSMAAKWRPLVLAMLVIALLLRILAAIVIERHVQDAGRQFLIEGDSNGYWILAQKIAAGEDYEIYTPPRRVLRMPGFPLLLAGSIRLFGDRIFAARIVLAFVGTACCWLTYLLGTRLVMRRVGFWAALFVAVNPLHVGNSVIILSETWFTFWMLLSLLALTGLLQAGQEGCSIVTGNALPHSLAGKTCAWRLWLRAILVGGLIGAASLVRPGFLPWLAFCFLAVTILVRRSFPARVVIATGLLIGCGLAMLPWTLRNVAVTGHWVVTSLWSGPSLYDGLNPEATGASDMQFFDRENVLSKMSEFEMNRHYKDRAVDFVKNHLGRAVELAFVKAVRFLNPVPNQLNSNRVIQGLCIIWYVAFLLLLVGAVWSRLLDMEGWVVVLGPFLLFLLVHMVFVGSVRYRLPVEFPMSVQAACGLRWLLNLRTQGTEMEKTVN